MQIETFQKPHQDRQFHSKRQTNKTNGLAGHNVTGENTLKIKISTFYKHNTDTARGQHIPMEERGRSN